MRSIVLLIMSMLTLGHLWMLAGGSCSIITGAQPLEGPQCSAEILRAPDLAHLPDDIVVPLLQIGIFLAAVTVFTLSAKPVLGVCTRIRKRLKHPFEFRSKPFRCDLVMLSEDSDSMLASAI